MVQECDYEQGKLYIYSKIYFLQKIQNFDIKATFREAKKSHRKIKGIDDFKEKTSKLKMKIINAESIDEIQKAQRKMNKLDQSASKSKRFRDVLNKYLLSLNP